VENYFLRINVEPTEDYFKPMENRQIIRFLLKEFSKCFDDQKNLYKKDEILQLSDILAQQP
jgi:hypothetical protein